MKKEQFMDIFMFKIDTQKDIYIPNGCMDTSAINEYFGTMLYMYLKGGVITSDQYNRWYITEKEWVKIARIGGK